MKSNTIPISGHASVLFSTSQLHTYRRKQLLFVNYLIYCYDVGGESNEFGSRDPKVNSTLPFYTSTVFACLFRLSRYNDGWMNGWMAVKMATWRVRKTIMSETCTYSCQRYFQTKTFMVKRHLRAAIVYMQVTYLNSAIKSDQIMESVNISHISFSTRGPFLPFIMYLV